MFILWNLIFIWKRFILWNLNEIDQLSVDWIAAPWNRLCAGTRRWWTWTSSRSPPQTEQVSPSSGQQAQVSLSMQINNHSQNTGCNGREWMCQHYVCPVSGSTARLTRLSDPAALWLRFVLGDTRPPGLGSLSLPVSSRLLRGLTLQQLLWTASPGEQTRPRRWRRRDQRLLAALSARTAPTGEGGTNKESGRISVEMRNSEYQASQPI